MSPLTKREESMLLDALHKAIQGQRVCFVVPNDEAVKERLSFIRQLPTDLFLINQSRGTVRTRMSLGEVRFHATAIDSRWCVGGLKGLEYDVAFFNESEPVPEEVLARVRKRIVKN